MIIKSGFFFTALFCLIMIAQLAQAGKKKFPDIDQFGTMPYETVSFNEVDTSTSTEETFSKLSRGQITVYCRGINEEVQQLTTTEIINFQMSQPHSKVDLAFLSDTVSIFFESIQRDIFFAQQKGDIKLKNAEIDLLLSEGYSGIETEKLVTTTRKSVHLSSMKTKNISIEPKEVEEDSNIKTLSDDKETRSTERQGNSKSVSKKMDVNIVKQINNVISKTSELFLNHNSHTAYHSTLEEWDSLFAEFGEQFGGTIEEFYELKNELGEQFIRVLIESKNSIQGIFESGFIEALVDSKFQPSLEEIEGFKTLLDNNGGLKDMVFRSFSDNFIEPSTIDKLDQATASTTITINPTPIYHGSLRGALISIKNDGEVPIYDMLIAIAIPENMEYRFFNNKSPFELGYLNHYLPSKQAMFVKLYRPLLPGQTFNELVWLKFDKWELQTNKI